MLGAAREVEREGSLAHGALERIEPFEVSVDVSFELFEPSVPELREGQIVDRYRIGAVLGIGGHGVVYAAEHVELGYRVAIKVLDRAAGRDPRRRARFAREAQVGARVRHRHIAGILEAGELECGTPYLVMEHVGGVDLATLLEREGRLAPDEAIEVGIALLAATAALSAHGVVHRDIKPENVMIARAVDGAVEIKLLDFGIAKAPSSSTEPRITLEGYVLGTPHYMSPEQIRGEPLDARSDLYAIGALLYQALSGTVPIDADDTDAVMTKMLVEEPVPLRQRRPDCPPSLEAIVMRALAKDRDARYRTPGAMAAALMKALDDLRVPRGSTWSRVAHVLGGPPPAAQARPEARSRGSWEAARRALPTPAERPSALRARRGRPRVCPPWWPAAAALILAAIAGCVALTAAGDAPGPVERDVTAPRSSP
ncbi:MAG TPA: serine/threonine-protein kinase [Sandaracinaceae bacterium]